VIPHGLVLNTQRQDANLEWDGVGGQPHYRIRLGGTISAVAGRLYQIQYSTPAFQSNDEATGRGWGGCAVVYSPNGGSITAGGSDNYRLPASRVFLLNTYAWRSEGKSFLVRCPEDIPAGKIMLGIEMWADAGCSGKTTSN